jgi:hypothetical protein
MSPSLYLSGFAGKPDFHPFNAEKSSLEMRAVWEVLMLEVGWGRIWRSNFLTGKPIHKVEI